MAEAERKIIDAAITCIEREGIQKVTTRSIAAEAKVNIAAINYYFRTKDNLIKRALEQTMTNTFEDLDRFIGDESLSIRERLARVFRFLLEGSARYPGLTKAHLHDALMLNRYDGGFIRRFNEYLVRVHERIVADSPDSDPEEVKAIIVMLFSAIFFPSLVPEFYSGLAQMDFRDAKTAGTYVDRLLNAILGVEQTV